MIFRNLSEAQDHHSCSSWKQVVIYRVTLGNGKVFFRTTLFDAYNHKCKRCRKARNQAKASGADHGRSRIPCSGTVCSICGNPFGAFTRRGRLGYRLSPGNPHATNTSSSAWIEGGALH